MNPDRTPPENLQAEQAVLGALLAHDQGTDLEGIYRLLRPEDFYRDAYARLYGVLLEMKRDGYEPDATTGRERLLRAGVFDACGGWDHLFVLMDRMNDVASVEDCVTVLRELSRRRQAIRAANELIAAAHQGGPSWDATQRTVQERLFEISLPDTAETRRTYAETFGGIYEEGVGRQQSVDITGIRTGFPGLDWMTNGLEPGKFWIVAARPSAGKTALSLSLLRAFVKTHPSVFFSLEQPQRDLVMRFYAMVAGVPYGVIGRQMWLGETLRRMSDAYAAKDWPLTVDDTSPLTVGEIRRRLLEARRDGRADVAVIDYVQLVDYPHQLSIHDGVSLVSKGLKAVAHELGIPVILLAQLNRDVEKRESHVLRLSDLRDSGSLEQDADVALFIDRDTTEDLSGVEAQECDLLVLKNRNGPVGKVPAWFRPETMFFCERGREDDDPFML